MALRRKLLQGSTMHPESSVVLAAAYYGHSKLLRVWLKTGRSYIYAGVSIECWEKFTTAPSKGQYYNQQIRERFEGIPI